MKRNEFIKSTVFGVGALSLSSHAFSESKRNALPKNEAIKPKLIKKGDGKKQIVLGDRQTVKLTGVDTNNMYTLIELNNSPGTHIPLHVHEDEDEVFHVLQGEFEMQIGTETKVLTAGDIMFCPRGIPHAFKVVGQNNARVMLSVFPAGLEHMFDELSMLPAGPPDFDKIVEISKKYNIQFV